MNVNINVENTMETRDGRKSFSQIQEALERQKQHPETGDGITPDTGTGSRPDPERQEGSTRGVKADGVLG